MEGSQDGGMLSPYRVLDLTDERGLLCGKILADLGADVIQVEPPHGKLGAAPRAVLSRRGPPERSLFWWSYAANKRSITLDVATADGQRLLKRLVTTADFLIESRSARRARGARTRLGRAFRDQPGPHHGVHHAVRTGRSLCRVQGHGPRRHGDGRFHVRDRRSRPRSAPCRVPALLASRGGGGRHGRDGGAHQSCAERPRPARRRLLSGSRGADPGQCASDLGGGANRHQAAGLVPPDGRLPPTCGSPGPAGTAS